MLVNNAADGSSQPLLETMQEHLESSFAVNVYGPVYLTQAVVDIGRMPKGGRILNIGSVASKMGMAMAAVYSAAKAAQDSFTASWAGEVIPPGRTYKRSLMLRFFAAWPHARYHGQYTCTWSSPNGYG